MIIYIQFMIKLDKAIMTYYYSEQDKLLIDKKYNQVAVSGIHLLGEEDLIFISCNQILNKCYIKEKLIPCLKMVFMMGKNINIKSSDLEYHDLNSNLIGQRFICKIYNKNFEKVKGQLILKFR